MGILILVGLLFGAVLGQFFKWFILFPAAALAVLLIVASPANMDHSFLGSLLQFGALSVSLQVGYVFGIVILFSIKALDSREHWSTETATSRNADSGEGFQEAVQSALGADARRSKQIFEDHRHSLPSGAVLVVAAASAFAAVAHVWYFSI
jgi:hypothetical protein